MTITTIKVGIFKQNAKRKSIKSTNFLNLLVILWQNYGRIIHTYSLLYVTLPVLWVLQHHTVTAAPTVRRSAVPGDAAPASHLGTDRDGVSGRRHAQHTLSGAVGAPVSSYIEGVPLSPKCRSDHRVQSRRCLQSTLRTAGTRQQGEHGRTDLQ